MKILLAPDKFKGSLSAEQVCRSISTQLAKLDPNIETILHPMADGGDGSLEILNQHLNLIKRNIQTSDPLGRALSTHYFTSEEAAFIELASASGLVLLSQKERNPMRISTFGTGKMVADAMSKGYKNIYLFLGGSATNDAGIGIASALGFDFFDSKGKILDPIGASLAKIYNIKNKKVFNFSRVSITLLCDVNNPFFGENGAAYVYGPQKGADEQDVRELNKGLEHFSNILLRSTGKNIAELPSAGAAGGVAGGLAALCKAKLEPGFGVISKLSKLEEKIQKVDYIISGEGRLDEQSLQGKVIDGMAKLAIKYAKPLSLFVGKNHLEQSKTDALNVEHILSISERAKDIQDAMSRGKNYLEQMASEFYHIALVKA